MNSSITGNHTYKTTGDVTVSEAVILTVAYTEVVTGIVGVPDGTAADTEFELPVGSIAKITGLRITNKLATDIHVRYNGASEDAHSVAAGGEVIISNPQVCVDGDDITAVSIVTTAAQVDD